MLQRYGMSVTLYKIGLWMNIFKKKVKVAPIMEKIIEFGFY